MNRFVIANPRRCIGCNTCMAACSSVHRAVGLQAQPRLTVTRTLEVTAPVLCRHCEDAPCARVCPVDAIKLTGEQVELNEQKCIGCKMCAIALWSNKRKPIKPTPSGMTTKPNPK